VAPPRILQRTPNATKARSTTKSKIGHDSVPSPVTGHAKTKQLEPEDVADRPALAEGVTLVGKLQGAGYIDQQWLVVRGQRFIQVSELLFRVAERANGERTIEEIARGVTDATQWLVTEDNVRFLIGRKLLPLGLIRPTSSSSTADTSASQNEMLRSPLAVNFRLKVSGPRFIDPVARALKVLFSPPILALMLIGIVVGHVWLFLAHGITGSILALVADPTLIMAVLPIVLVAALFHELGHAAALRYGGGRARSMGVGVYLVFPAFYTDVTESYKLDRRGRLRTDLGGPYFHLIFGVALLGVYALTGAEFLLVSVLLIDVEVIRQFLPFGRLDGYWVLADLTGVPDFFSQIIPFLLTVLPIPRPEDVALPALKPAARRIFAAYILAVLVGFPLVFLYTVTRLPDILSAAWIETRQQASALALSWSTHHVAGVLEAGFEIFVVSLQVAAIGLFFFVLAWRPLRSVWRWSRSQPGPVRRTARGGLVTALGGVLLIIGALAPWQHLRLGAFGVAQDIKGISTGTGKVVLGCGIMLAVAGITTLLAWNWNLRRVGAATALGLSLLGGALMVHDIRATSSELDQLARQAIMQSSRQVPTGAEMSFVERQFSALGISLGPSYGAFAALAGALVGLGGAMTALATRSPRVESLQTNSDGLATEEAR
jgi:putative peptide zinc metalloprotease protein